MNPKFCQHFGPEVTKLKRNELVISVLFFLIELYLKTALLGKMYSVRQHIVSLFAVWLCDLVAPQLLTLGHGWFLLPGIIYTYLYCQVTQWSSLMRSGSLHFPLAEVYLPKFCLARLTLVQQPEVVTGCQLLGLLLWRPAGEMSCGLAKKPRSNGLGHLPGCCSTDSLHAFTFIWSNGQRGGPWANSYWELPISPRPCTQCFSVRIRCKMWYYMPICLIKKCC